MSAPLSQPSVALLGTSTMGDGMARNIAAAGLPLTVWNRTREKALPLAEVGARVAETPAEAVAGARIVVTMLFDAASVEQTMRQAAEQLAAGTIWIQMSTVGAAGIDRLAEVADEVGVVLVDAPVLGTRGPAQQGSLVILASGPADAQDTCAPVFEAVGSRTMWVGEAGAGSRLKLVCNGWVLMVVDGIAASLSLAKGLGLDPALFMAAVAGMAMDAPYVQLKGKAMLAGDFEPQFALNGALKDAGLILDAATDVGVDASVLAAVREHFRAAQQAGHGADDLGAVFNAHRVGGG